MKRKIKIGINGFGRIGRLATRIILKRDDCEVVRINDPFITPDYAKYLLTYDTVHKTLDAKVTVKDNILSVDGKKIEFVAKMNPDEIDWTGVDVVLECTGKFTKNEDASKHLVGGAKKVVVSAPGKNMPIFVYGVNHTSYDPKITVVSNASCTTNCLAPLAKVLDDAFGIQTGIMQTIHSTTATQLTVDGVSKKDWRGGRAASANIIPSSTGAAKAVGEVIPHLKGHLTGMSYRVPTINVSVVNLVCTLKKPATYEQVVEAVRKASKTNFAGIIATTSEPVVSSDFIGDSHTCIFDETAGFVEDSTFNLVAWYDNEFGYSCKLVDLAVYIANAK